MTKVSEMKEVVLPIELKVAESTYKKLSEAIGDGNIGASLQSLISDFLNQFADGGFVITSSDIDHMSKAAGKRVDTSRAVVEIVDEKNGKHYGAHSFRVTVDPNMVGTFNDVAHSRGMTMQDIVEEAWNSVTAMGWLYAVPTPCEHFFINPAQHLAASRLLGKNGFSGADLVVKMASLHADNADLKQEIAELKTKLEPKSDTEAPVKKGK